MNKEEIITKLRRGDSFYNPHTSTDIFFVVVGWDGISKTANVVCFTHYNNGYLKSSWNETWDDMDITVNAFLIGEYQFFNFFN